MLRILPKTPVIAGLREVPTETPRGIDPSWGGHTAYGAISFRQRGELYRFTLLEEVADWIWYAWDIDRGEIEVLDMSCQKGPF